MRRTAPLLLVLAAACATGDRREVTAPVDDYVPPLDASAEQIGWYREAAAAHAEAPNEANHAWLGRRFAYLGDYETAIATYRRGLEVYPRSFVLRRHLGHRLITTRRFAEAEAVLAEAAALAPARPLVPEPPGDPTSTDGAPSSVQFGIHYHLGLARYLLGDWEGALEAYEDCLESAAGNDERGIACQYWIVLTSWRAERPARAAAALRQVHADMEVVENTPYHRMCLVFRGDLTLEEVLPDLEANDAPRFDTHAYGAARWLVLVGRQDAGHRLLETITRGPRTIGFGHIAAEADLARLRDTPAPERHRSTP